jgi:hypothetical protein
MDGRLSLNIKFGKYGKNGICNSCAIRSMWIIHGHVIKDVSENCCW